MAIHGMGKTAARMVYVWNVDESDYNVCFPTSTFTVLEFDSSGLSPTKIPSLLHTSTTLMGLIKIPQRRSSRGQLQHPKCQKLLMGQSLILWKGFPVNLNSEC